MEVQTPWVLVVAVVIMVGEEDLVALLVMG